MSYRRVQTTHPSAKPIATLAQQRNRSEPRDHSGHGIRGEWAKSGRRVAMTVGVKLPLLCFLLALVGSRAQTDAVTPWLDVCTSEDLINYRDQLCPATFVVSTLAFNPLYPLAVSNMTIILQPSEDLQSSIQTTQYVDLNLPGFEPRGTVNIANANLQDLPISAGNTVLCRWEWILTLVGDLALAVKKAPVSSSAVLLQ
eukprot:Skav202870  [mRNA]  locus=scaffold3541:26892:34082:- [translate_table: standard]